MSATTFLACPACSVPPQWMNFPSWRRAARTSEKRGVSCAFVVGCRHVTEMFATAIVEAPQAAATVARWNAEAQRLFDTYTATWTTEQRAAYRQRLGWAPLAETAPAAPAATTPKT